MRRFLAAPATTSNDVSLDLGEAESISKLCVRAGSGMGPGGDTFRVIFGNSIEVGTNVAAGVSAVGLGAGGAGATFALMSICIRFGLSVFNDKNKRNRHQIERVSIAVVVVRGGGGLLLTV
jgi:hypothetical protein